MGSYSSTANTAKESTCETLGAISYGVSEMQGWRKTMEDTHIATRIAADAATAAGAPDAGATWVFGVFDGHGGREVAHFCKSHFVATLPTLPDWERRAFEPLLHQAFLNMDVMLVDERYQRELFPLRVVASASGGGVASPSGRAGGAFTADAMRMKLEAGQPIPIEDAAQMLRELLTTKRQAASAAAATAAAASEAPPQLPQPPAADSDAALVASLATAAVGAPSAEPPALPPSLRALAAGSAVGAPGAPAGFGSGDGVGVALVADAPAAATPASRPVDPARQVQSGCTAIVACVHGGVLHVANAGDSRGVLCRGGRAVALSHDHKPQAPTELARIQRAGGWVNEAGRVNGNLNLSRSIGDLRYKRNAELPAAEQAITAAPDVLSIPLEAGDEFFVLACDGIWDCKSNEQVVRFVRNRLLSGRAAPAPPLPPRLSSDGEWASDSSDDKPVKRSTPGAIAAATASATDAEASASKVDAPAAKAAAPAAAAPVAAAPRSASPPAVAATHATPDAAPSAPAGPALLASIVEALFDDCISPNPEETGGIGADNMTCLIVDLRAYVAVAEARANDLR
jgi:serine/threonine protein phosphatase PrpC